jgi:putative membrane protein
MYILSNIFIALVAIEHLYILYMEMFAWETLGKKTFKKALPEELFKPTKGLAANQGLYNGFLAAGLIWSLFISDPQWSFNVSTFFLSCVIVAGLYGAITASKSIFFKQALPAIITLILSLLSKSI